MLWLRNGVTTVTDTPGTTSYDATKSIALSGSFTYVRAELRAALPSDARLAMTEPIFFETVPSLPNGMSYHVEGVQTADGKGYTKTDDEGHHGIKLRRSDEDALDDAQQPGERIGHNACHVPWTGAAVDEPNRVTVGSVASQAAFDAATGSAWFYEPAPGLLHVKVLDTSSPDTVALAFAPSSDTTAPSVPTGVAAVANGTDKIDVSWTAVHRQRGGCRL